MHLMIVGTLRWLVELQGLTLVGEEGYSKVKEDEEPNGDVEGERVCLPHS